MIIRTPATVSLASPHLAAKTPGFSVETEATGKMLCGSEHDVTSNLRQGEKEGPVQRMRKHKGRRESVRLLLPPWLSTRSVSGSSVQEWEAGREETVGTFVY